ncbi:MAG TPA: preprotein translocase subunit SecG [Thermoanaerobaculia bacterium]|nr:preprotein translocase subunit SecG [Thermoanaerobaculia bacterium]
MIYVLYFIHVVVSLFLVLVVLLQQGKGADLSVFGGGATQAAFGARGSVNVLHRLTVICFVVFILTTLSIGLFQARGNPSVMRGVEVEEGATTPAPAPQPPASDPQPADGGVEQEAASAPVDRADGPTDEPPPSEPPPSGESDG